MEKHEHHFGGITPSDFTPFVSVIVLTYNRRDLLKKCLESILSQSYSNYEIIVLDEFSQDETNLMVSGLMNLHDNITLIQREQKGLAYGRNKGIEAANGNIIAFIDDDETAEKYWIENGIEPIYKENADIVVGAVYLPDGKLFKELNDNTPEFATANIFFKKQVLIELGLFDERFVFGSEDIDLSLSAAEEGCKYVICREAITYHPARTQTITNEFVDLLKTKRKRLTNSVLRFKKHSSYHREKFFLKIFFKKSHIIPTIFIFLCCSFFVNFFTIHKNNIYLFGLLFYMLCYLSIRVLEDKRIDKYLFRIILFPYFFVYDFIEFFYIVKGSIKYRYFVL